MKGTYTMPKQKKTNNLNVRITPEMREALTAQALTRDESEAAIVRRALKRELEQNHN